MPVRIYAAPALTTSPKGGTTYESIFRFVARVFPFFPVQTTVTAKRAPVRLCPSTKDSMVMVKPPKDTRACLVLFVLVAAAACSSQTNSPGYVSMAEYGERWPFTVPDGTLYCYNDGPRKHVVLNTGNGIQYGLNGAARGAGKFPDSKDIMKPDKFGVHLQPFIDRGLTLCK